MKRFACAAALLGGLVGLGCDDTPQPPPALIDKSPQEDAAPTRPTTQSLLQGPRTTVPLGFLPLTARVPVQWQVDVLERGTISMLTGPTPFGDVAIQLVDRATTTPAKIDAIVTGAKREMQANPTAIRMADVRSIPGAQVLERQRVGAMPKPSPLDEEGIKPSPMFSWTVSVFIPNGEVMENCELNFIGLTLDQYEADEALLREIINSITVTTNAGAATAPAATQ